jgi:hypothetical protein
MSENENKLDLNAAVTEAELQNFYNSLTEDERKQVRQRQLLNAVDKKSEAEPDWSRLDDGAFLKERLRRYGF